MSHVLVRRPTHGNNSKENAQSQQALNANSYVASIYVGRRKVWEARAATEAEAFRKAEAQKTQYAGANPEIKTKKVKPGQ
jgi:hypothetical protein